MQTKYLLTGLKYDNTSKERETSISKENNGIHIRKLKIISRKISIRYANWEPEKEITVKLVQVCQQLSHDKL